MTSAPETLAAPFTEEQIAWLDARYRKSLPHLEQVLTEQGGEAPSTRSAEQDDDA